MASPETESHLTHSLIYYLHQTPLTKEEYDEARKLQCHTLLEVWCSQFISREELIVLLKGTIGPTFRES